MKHSRYLGSSSICLNSFLIPSGTPSLIISVHVTPCLFVADLLAPFRRRALTGLVDFRASTDLMAKCRGV